MLLRKTPRWQTAKSLPMNFMSKTKPETEAISIAESKRLIQLEKVIKTGEQTFIEVGNALLEIRDSKLYRADFSSFDEYCLEKWGWGRKRGYELIIAAKTLDSLPEKCHQLVTNANQATALSKVSAPKRPAVLQKIQDAGKPVTAQNIAVAAAPEKKPTAPRVRKPVVHEVEVKLDEIGRAIPDAMLAIFERGHEVEQLIALIRRVKTELTKAEKENDPLYRHMTFQRALMPLDKIAQELKETVPYALCPDCHGKNPDDCTTCKHTGFVGKFTWDHLTPEEKKTLILKTVKK